MIYYQNWFSPPSKKKKKILREVYLLIVMYDRVESARWALANLAFRVYHFTISFSFSFSFSFSTTNWFLSKSNVVPRDPVRRIAQVTGARWYKVGNAKRVAKYVSFVFVFVFYHCHCHHRNWHWHLIINCRILAAQREKSGKGTSVLLLTLHDTIACS